MMDLEIAEFGNWVLLRLARAGSDTARNLLKDRRKAERREYDARELWSVCARVEMAQALGLLHENFTEVAQQAVDEIAKHEGMSSSFWQFPAMVGGDAQVGGGDAIPLLRRFVSLEEEWVADMQLQLFVDLVLARLRAPEEVRESGAKGIRMLGPLIYEYGPLIGKVFQFWHDVVALDKQLVAGSAAQRCLSAKYKGLDIAVRELWLAMKEKAGADASGGVEIAPVASSNALNVASKTFPGMGA